MRTTTILLLAGATAVTAARSHGAEAWTAIQTPNFTVVSNAGEGTAQQTANEFEQVRAAYSKIWPSGQLPQGKPTVVLALRNEATLRRFAPGYFEVKGGIDVVSGSAEGLDRHYLLLRTDWRPTERQVTPNYNLYRSYVGLLLRGSFERRLPLWLSSGLAEVLANIVVQEGEIHVGRPVPWYFSGFRENARHPLQAVLDARPESPLVQKEAQRPQFDAQCYILVHYLMYGDRGAHAPQLARFLRLWLAGRSHDQAWSESLGSVTAIEAALPNYASLPVISFARIAAEARVNKQRFAARALPPADAAGLLASVHVAMGRPVEAQAALREARTADPGSPASYDAEGQLADRDRDTASATQAYFRAVELGSTSAYSHYRAAQLAWKADADAATLARLRGLLERALALNGSYANACSFLAEVLVQQGDAKGALAAAERAVSLEPGYAYHRVALARALHALGRADEALQAVDAGLQLAEDDAERSHAERFKLYLTQTTRYERERAAQDEAQKRASACQGGDTGACRAMLPELEERCAAKQADACSSLSWLYGGGGGLPKDPAKAADCVARACAAGDKRACVEDAWARAHGESVPKDEAGAKADLDALCAQPFYPACTRLALVHAAKPGQADRARARELLARACQGGEADACSMAGRLK
jgi:tetratricopeptide (TPR) repeat protein